MFDRVERDDLLEKVESCLSLIGIREVCERSTTTDGLVIYVPTQEEVDLRP